jgi:sugar lactone lactonase YvrE
VTGPGRRRRAGEAAARDFAGVRLIPVGGPGPEDVVVDDAGNVYAGLADGRLVRVGAADGRVETVAHLPGRPLGIELYGSAELVVCASDAGLLSVALDGGRIRTLAAEFDGRRLGAVNNAAVAADGTIWFSDSSTRFPVPEWRSDLVQRSRTGRLLRRDPDGTLTEVLGGLEFANGVALAGDGSYVAVAETGARRVRRLWLTGAQAGEDDVLAHDLWGYPDNLSLGSDGLIWVALPGPRAAALDVVQRLPVTVRTLLRRLPQRVQPAPAPEVGVVALDDTGRTVHRLIGTIEGLTMLTGVREAGGTLWFANLTGDRVATLVLPQSAGDVP